jgi:hypothetical protein
LKREAAAAAIVAAATLLLWAPLWSGAETLFVQDAAAYFLPMKAALGDMVRAGEWPWWNPWLRNGLPFYANPQVGLFYPLSVPFYLLPTPLAFNWVVILHFVLLATGFSAWLRGAGRSPAAAAFAGLAVAWGGYAISMTTYLNNLQAMAWIGWTWWAWERWLDGRAPRWLALTATGFALEFLAGEPQTAVVTAAIAVLIAWTRPAGVPGDRREPAAPIAALGVAALGALLATAVQFVPTAELFLRSQRGAGLPTEEILAWSLDPSQVHNLLLPRPLRGPDGMFDLRGVPVASSPWVFTSYLGVGVVLLAIAGVDREGRRATLLWGGLAAAGVFLALGEHNPAVSALADLTLGPRAFRYPEKMLILPAIAVPVLAATGFDRLREPAAARRLVVAAVGVGALAGAGWLLARVGGFAAVLGPAPDLLPGSTPDQVVAALAWGFRHVALFTILLAGAAILGRRLDPAVAGLLIAVVAAVDLAVANTHAAGLMPSRLFTQQPPVLEGLPLEELRTSARIRTTPLGADAWGWYTVPGISSATQQYLLFATMGPNLSMAHGVLAEDGAEAFRPRSDDMQAEILEDLPLPLQVRQLRLQSAKWILWRPILVEGLEPVSRERDVHGLFLFRVVDDLPRAYLVGRAEVEPDSVAILNRFIAGGEDPHRIAFVSAGPGLDGPAERIDGSVRWLPGSNHSIRLAVRAPARSLLVLTDTWYPGWTATVDGVTAPIERVNGHFKGVYLEPGEHRVRFDYRPRGMAPAALASAIGLLTLVAGIAFGGKRRGA